MHDGREGRVQRGVERRKAVEAGRARGVGATVRATRVDGLQADGAQREVAGADGLAGVGDDVELQAGRVGGRRSQAGLRMPPPPRRSRAGARPAARSTSRWCRTLRATASTRARYVLAGVVASVRPTSTPRASGSRSGVRSPARYGSARTPPAPGGSAAAAAASAGSSRPDRSAHQRSALPAVVVQPPSSRPSPGYGTHSSPATARGASTRRRRCRWSPAARTRRPARGRRTPRRRRRCRSSPSSRGRPRARPSAARGRRPEHAGDGERVGRLREPQRRAVTGQRVLRGRDAVHDRPAGQRGTR